MPPSSKVWVLMSSWGACVSSMCSAVTATSGVRRRERVTAGAICAHASLWVTIDRQALNTATADGFCGHLLLLSDLLRATTANGACTKLGGAPVPPSHC
eukprot:scaffold180548_cov17-Tisochrysis_lutea.AAC.2